MKLRRKQSKDSAGQEESPKKSRRVFRYLKLKFPDDIVKFFVAKGLVKKKWIIVKEIPALEIEHIEKLGNELSVTWKGATDAFFTKGKTDLFSKLVGQVNGMLNKS
jgi:hypothetical protein